MTGAVRLSGDAIADPFPGVVEALRRPGYAFVGGTQIGSALALTATERATFAGHWNDLVLDPYVGTAEADRFRYRRYGRLALHHEGALHHERAHGGAPIRLTPLPNRRFQQAAEHVQRYGGQARQLHYVTDAFLTDPVLHRLIALDYRLLPEQPESYEVGLHAIRVRVTPAVDARPTPEGRHRDGHDFIAMHLIGKRGCRGGETLVYEQRDARPEVIDRMTLSEPFDTLLVDDTAVDHEVTSLEPVSAEGARDVLLVAFYPLTGPDGVGNPLR
jgi:hypothetical protein